MVVEVLLLLSYMRALHAGAPGWGLRGVPFVWYGAQRLAVHAVCGVRGDGRRHVAQWMHMLLLSIQFDDDVGVFAWYY